MGNDSSAWSIFVMLFVVAVFAVGGYACNVSQCEHVCTANKHESEYVIMQGCYCRTEEGLYNPRDSR